MSTRPAFDKSRTQKEKRRNISDTTLRHQSIAHGENGELVSPQNVPTRDKGNISAGEKQIGDAGIRFQKGEPVEEKGNLVAVHNLSEDKIRQAFDLGGFPMPSIAITKADIGHTEFGDISLVFDKESINPADRRNKVYGEDAWTPSFPQIGYKLNEKKTDDIYTRANKVGSLPLFRPVSFHPDNYERVIDGMGSESLVKKFKDDYGAKQFYLAENGNAVQEYERREVEKYPADKIALHEDVLKTIGIDRLKNESKDALKDDVKRLLGQHGINLDGMQPFRVNAWIDTTIKNALDYAENGNRKIETDTEATQRKIDERIDPEKFEAWLKKMFDGIVEKRGIRNSTDWFTPSGNRRKWEALFDAITLDNVVNAMQRQNAKGGQGLFGSSIFGAAQEEYRSIEEIRAAARQRLQDVSDEDTKEARKEIEGRLSAIKIPGSGDKVSDVFDMVENIQDAVAKSHTAKGIYNYLRDFYPGMTMDIAKEIEGIVKDIQKMTGRYFEAKPYRAVGFGEVKLAVVPDNIDKGILDRLKQLHIPVETYEHGNNEQRVQILNDATERQGLRFRFVGDMFKAAEPRPSSTSAAAKRQAAEALSKRLGVPVVIEDKTTPRGKSKRFAGVKGWFVLPNAQNPNGTIHVNVDNHAGVEDVERTMLHEVVAHMGMRKMMGEEKYNALLDKVYGSMDAAARAYFEAYAAKDFVRREGMTEEAYRAELQRIAADEYIAALAEVGADPSTWQKVVALVREALRALGFNLRLSDADIRALLYESKHNLESAAYSAEREMMRREQKEFRDEADLSNRIEEDERALGMDEGGIEETNGRFNEELDKQIRGELPKDHIYQLGKPSERLLSVGFPNMPIELSSTNLAEHAKKTRHPFDLKDVKGLVNALQNPIAVFSYGDKGKSQNVIVEIQKDGRNFLVGVHFNQNRNGIEVSSIRGIFPKDNAEWLNWISQGKGLFLDKEKIQTLISQQRKNLADVKYLDLDSVAKIVESFENPKLNAETAPAVRMRRAGTAYDPRLGVISLDENAEEYDRYTAQGLYRQAVNFGQVVVDEDLKVRSFMTHLKRLPGAIVSAATDLWNLKTAVVSKIQYEIKKYNDTIGEPLSKTLRSLYRETKDLVSQYFDTDKIGGKNELYYLSLYLQAKHIPERNAWMAANFATLANLPKTGEGL